MANDNLKKPKSDNNVPLTEEDKDKRKKIIILVVLIVVVLAILIGTAYYFSNNDKDKGKDDLDKNNPGNVVKPNEDDKKDPEPVVEEKPDNNVIVYRPVSKPKVDTPTEKPIEPTTPTITETTITGNSEDPLVNVKLDSETNTIKVTGVSRYVAKVNPNFGEGYNNIIQVKVALNTKYTYADLQKQDFTIMTLTNTGAYNIYGLEALDSTEDGNLYFYWMQAVGLNCSKNPKIIIDYGDGTKEEYTMDLSGLSVQTPVSDEEASKLALLPQTSSEMVIGGQVLSYEMLVLESQTIDEMTTSTEEKDESNKPVVASTLEGENALGESGTEGEETTTPTEPTIPETEPDLKEYVLKFTKVANYYSKDVTAQVGLGDYNNIIQVRIYAPKDWTEDLANKVDFEKTVADGEKAYEVDSETNSKTYFSTVSTNSYVNVLKDSNNRYLIIVTMAVDEGTPRAPFVKVDWDGEETKYGDVRYSFDISELELAKKDDPVTDLTPDTPDYTLVPKEDIPESGESGANVIDETLDRNTSEQSENLSTEANIIVETTPEDETFDDVQESNSTDKTTTTEDLTEEEVDPTNEEESIVVTESEVSEAQSNVDIDTSISNTSEVPSADTLDVANTLEDVDTL